MAAPPTVGADKFDKLSFQRYMNDHGRAYRNQAMELISICRLFSLAAEKVFTQDTALSRALRVCDDALSRAAEARKSRTLISDHGIQLAIRELNDYQTNFHFLKENTIESVEARMNEAKSRDREESGNVGLSSLSRFAHLSFKPRKTGIEDRVVIFRLMNSITDTRPTLVPQVLNNGSNEPEILWNFNRYPPASRKRVTLAENPHFYDRLPSPHEYQDGFTTDPVGYFQEANSKDIYDVLTNKPGRVFFEFGGDSRAFDNVWRTNEIFIFKSICGKLESERLVGASIQGRSCMWCYVGPLPSQQQVESTVDLNPHSTSAIATDTPTWELVEDWRNAVFHVLHSPDIKIRITIVLP